MTSKNCPICETEFTSDECPNRLDVNHYQPLTDLEAKCLKCGAKKDGSCRCIGKSDSVTFTLNPASISGTCGKCGAPWFYDDKFKPKPTCACWNLPKIGTCTDTIGTKPDGSENKKYEIELLDAIDKQEDRALEAEAKLELIRKILDGKHNG